ncbi:MAG: hypothetical protein KBE16_00865 [Alphaproteobacteria bacterium]|nr:hypothetical protein [Alphaproteobacteria bacterium]MBP9877583.1 hypothetical protein [Alphaproteobacteria bacterium]
MTNSHESLLKIKINQSILAMESLMSTLDQEVELIEKRNHKAFSQIFSKKENDIRNYEQAMYILLAEKEGLKSLPEEVKDALQQMQKKLNQSIRRNALKVRAHLHAHEKLVNLIKEEVVRAQAAMEPYDYLNKSAQLKKVPKRSAAFAYSINS